MMVMSLFFGCVDALFDSFPFLSNQSVSQSVCV